MLKNLCIICQEDTLMVGLAPGLLAMIVVEILHVAIHMHKAAASKAQRAGKVIDLEQSSPGVKFPASVFLVAILHNLALVAQPLHGSMC